MKMSELHPNALFSREYVLVLGTTKITNLHIEFDVVRTGSSEPNTASLVLYNLSPETRKKISEKRHLPVTLSAGYSDASSLIFKGKIIRTSTSRQGGDWVTVIDATDGSVEIGAGYDPINLPPGISVEEAAKTIADKLNLGGGSQSAAKALYQKFKDAGGVSGMVQFVRGMTLGGGLYDWLTELGKSLNLKTSIQDEILVAVGSVRGVSNATAYALSSKTGLLGSPEVGDEGTLTLTTLMIPQLRPNDPVQLDAEVIKGRYRIEKVEFVGQFRGSDWYSILEVKPI